MLKRAHRRLTILVRTLALVLIAGLAAAAIVVALNRADSGPTPTPTPAPASTPRLYTADNGDDVWAHPERHLGARIQVLGRVDGSRAVRDGRLVAVRVNQSLIAVHVFDRQFKIQHGARLSVVGTVRGPLGDPQVPHLPTLPPLHPGTAVIDAAAASRL